MGHGDEIVLADANFPSESIARANGAELICCDGVNIPKLLKHVLRLFPLDAYVKQPVALMDLVQDDKNKRLEVPIWQEYQTIVNESEKHTVQFEMMDRFEFYDRAKKAFAIVRTGEGAIYANIILKKGVIPKAENKDKSTNHTSNVNEAPKSLIRFRGDSISNKYGAIERLRTAILPVISHGVILQKNGLYETLWQFILKLNSHSEKYIKLLQDVYNKDNIRLSVETWIDQSVISQCLSIQLSNLEHHPDLIQQYYIGSCLFVFSKNSA
ncbi:unnamed protein product [Didymodactylos carnosus]|uniref:L-fucose mutarotase n=1 Tax=Didymodactylos carnosus TaxID=1234261 RepID=A0A813PQB3_9BILA|nr:unnamed protein product [Didymodactylos carnosus]CAF0838573.1 unnamed protein product [Didymodactylos carnosus]CAF3534428.1 unnamed protein product [Didymodactylos carnosus]CAF3623481.1 unnamed protein product [Didymodactylos carnosus]